MTMSGRTPSLGIPYPLSGDMPTGDDFASQATILDNYLRGAQVGSGGTRVYADGFYTFTNNASNVVTVTVTGNPAVSGIVNGSFLELDGVVSWPDLTPGSFYYLYVVGNSNLYQNPSSATAVSSTSQLSGTQYLFLATLDNRTSGAPVLNSEPIGKPTATNLYALLNSPTNPFGATLVQSNITVTNSMTINLGAAQTLAVNQGLSTATKPSVTVQQACPNFPHVKGTVGLRLGDSRTTAAGIELSDATYTGLPYGATSLLGAINLGNLPRFVALTDGATVATDATAGQAFSWTIGGNRTLSNPTGGIDGQQLLWRIRQDATGSRLLTLDSAFRLNNTVPNVLLSTASGAVDYLVARYVAADSAWDVVAFSGHTTPVVPSRVVVRTVTTTASVSLNDYLILANTTGGSFTVTLPSAVTALIGKPYRIKQISSSNALTVASGGGNIDGSATKVYAAQNEVHGFVSDGTNWFIDSN